jgi:hypothetical protein
MKRTLLLLAGSALCALGCESRALPVGDAAAPDTRPRAAPEASSPRFGIHLFAGHISMAYDYASLEAATAGLKTADAALALSELDVEQYRTDPVPSSRLLLRLTQAASDRHGAYLRATKGLQPFFVTLDGQKLFVGVIYIMYGAAGIMTPVLHVDSKDPGRVELKLGRHMGAWAGWGKPGAGLQSIDHASVRQLFEDQHKLSPL